MLEFRQRLPKTSLLQNRVSWILEQCAGQRVLDVGCVDSGLLEERASKGKVEGGGQVSRLSFRRSLCLGPEAPAPMSRRDDRYSTREKTHGEGT